MASVEATSKRKRYICSQCRQSFYDVKKFQTCVVCRNRNKLRKKKSREEKKKQQNEEEIKRRFSCSIRNAKKMIKKNGFAVLTNVLKLPVDNQHLFETVINKAKFEVIFETLSFKNGRAHSDGGSRRRQQTSTRISKAIANWGELENKLRILLSDIYEIEIGKDFKFEFVCLKSLPHTPAQSVHCDHTHEGYLQNSNSEFDDLNLFIPISFKNDTFLDIRRVGSAEWFHIPVNRGDIIMFRGDVAHRGVKHDENYIHYRLHCSVDHGHVMNTTTYVSVPFQ